MPDGVTDTGVYEVDLGKLRECIASGKKALAQMDELSQQMRDRIGGPSGTVVFWEGVAAEEYRSVFEAEMEALARDLAEFSTYVGELETYLHTYEEADAKAKDLAQDIEQPAAWEEV